MQPAKLESVKVSSSSNGSSCSSRSNAEEDERLLVFGRSASIFLASCDSSISDDVDDCRLTSTFPKVLSYQKKSCCCLSIDTLSGGGGGQQICGWESRSVAKNSRNSHHNFSLSWIMGVSFNLSEVRTKNSVSKKNSNLCESESKFSVNHLGYSSSMSVNHTPFQHHIDEDMTLYIKQYRKLYTYHNLDKWTRKMRVETRSANISQISPKLITLGNAEGQSRRALSSKCLSKRQNYEISTDSCSNFGSTRAEKHAPAPPYGSGSWMPPSTNSKQLYCAKSIHVSNSRSLRINSHHQAHGMHEGVEIRQPSSSLRLNCTECHKKAVCTRSCLHSMPSQHIPPARTSAHSTALHVHLAPNLSALRTSSTHHAITNSLNADNRKKLSRSTNKTLSWTTSSPKGKKRSIIPNLLCLETKPFPTISADHNAPGWKPTHTTKRSKSTVSYGKLKAGK